MEIQASLFDLPEDIHYLNCAYMSPLLNTCVETGNENVRKKSRPYLIKAPDFFDESNQLRSAFADLINAEDSDQIVIIPSSSYGISTIAKNLIIQPNSSIILTGEQFPSNTYPWFRAAEKRDAQVKIIDPPDTLKTRGENWNNAILAAIDDSTSVVAISICHWTDGTLFDMQAIREKTLLVGAALVIDGTQSIGVLPFDVKEIRPDALICASYKWLLGPYSIGLAYFDPKYNDGIPLEENWINRKFSEKFAGLVDYQHDYQPGALRFDVGEHSNFALVPMLLTSIRQILKWKPQEIQNYCSMITSEGINKLRDFGCWVESDNFRGAHLFGIRVPSHIDIERIKMVFEQKNIFVSIRGTSIRVSPHVYNYKSSFDLLVDTLIHEIEN